MNIKQKIFEHLIPLLCGKARARERILAELLRHHTGELIAELSQHHAGKLIDEALSSHKDALLPLLAETMCGQNVTDRELALLAYAANSAFHYSQEGEDIILARLLGQQANGFFVDVGAHHPTRFSNTYALYRKGWRGINIDATPGSMAAFAQRRPEDINIESAVSDTTEPLAFHMFKEPALNTFDAALAESYVAQGWERHTIQNIVPRPLAGILDEHLPPGTKIDLMSIDVEGGEMGVLRSNDWARYAAKYLVLEVLDTPLTEIMDDPAVLFLLEKGYAPISKLAQSLILQKL